MLLLLLLSHFSRVWLCVTPETAAHQAPPSLGFSRQEHWSGLPFPFPTHESEKWKRSRSVVSDSSWPHGLQPTRLLRPWDFPGKSTGVGCHRLLRYICYIYINIYLQYMYIFIHTYIFAVYVFIYICRLCLYILMYLFAVNTYILTDREQCGVEFILQLWPPWSPYKVGNPYKGVFIVSRGPVYNNYI